MRIQHSLKQTFYYFYTIHDIYRTDWYIFNPHILWSSLTEYFYLTYKVAACSCGNSLCMYYAVVKPCSIYSPITRSSALFHLCIIILIPRKLSKHLRMRTNQVATGYITTLRQPPERAQQKMADGRKGETVSLKLWSSCRICLEPSP